MVSFINNNPCFNFSVTDLIVFKKITNFFFFKLHNYPFISLIFVTQLASTKPHPLSKVLNQKDDTGFRNWLARLTELELVQSRGKTKENEYFVNPDYLRKLNFKGKTDLKKIKPYRLQELIYEDLSAYPNSQIGDIHTRIVKEIAQRKLKAELDKMVETAKLNKA